MPTITLEGDANGAPHPDPSAYAAKFSGPYSHRTIEGGIGHNLPQEAPEAFADAILHVGGGGMSLFGVRQHRRDSVAQRGPPARLRRRDRLAQLGAAHRRRSLRGKVVLVDFWTYTCINWLRTLGYVRAWAEKYRDQGLVVVGVHTPEFPFESDVDNVRRAANGHERVEYPIALDSDYGVWRDFGNRYWPAVYISARSRTAAAREPGRF